jgi:23S rRNA (uracil1939-C5)-methyltransferase
MSGFLRGERLVIEKLGQRGEGVARGPNGLVFTPYAIPGDLALVEVEGERGRLIEILEPSPDRTPAFCGYFGVCGGCAVQSLRVEPYRAWKRDLVVQALRHSRIAADVDALVEPLVDAHGEGRRRATFHARAPRDALGRVRVEAGFMKARAHDIVEIDACPILAPELAGAPQAARALARTLASLGKPLDILVTASLSGLDVDLRGCGELAEAPLRAALAEAERLDLARISNHGRTLLERRAPLLRMGRATLVPPPGAFLQATAAGEEALARIALDMAGAARRAVDLFAGVGTFALRLAERATVDAVEADKAALAALARASGDAGPALKPIATQTRDLFRRPFTAAELAPYDVALFDPPRAGAEAQARELAASRAPRVIAVSCNPQTFARDARILIDGGYALERVVPVDQFRHSAHVELVAAFSRDAGAGAGKSAGKGAGKSVGKSGRKRLLG